MKFAATILALFLSVGSLMAADNSSRFETVGGKIMCTCSCGQMLLKCNHVGCPNSAAMLRQLHDQLAATDDDQAVLNFFRKEWGVTAVVEPDRHGFELLAWILPFAGLGVGVFLLVMVVHKWHVHEAEVKPVEARLDPHLESLRARARKETEI